MPIATAIRPGRGVLRGRGFNQKELVDILRALRNRVLGHPALVGPATLGFSTFDYTIDGQTFTKAGGTQVLTGQNLVSTSAGQFCKVRVQIDAAGAITFTQSGFAGSQEDARIPPRTPSRCTIGLLDIPASFVFGTTTLATAGIIASGDPDLGPQSLDG